MKKNLKVMVVTIVLLLLAFAICGVLAKAETKDTWIPQSQVNLCYQIGAEQGIQPELLMSIIEAESSGQMSARNGSCYGICQINGAVHGYGYTTEESQIRKACELLKCYNCEVDEALARYNGQRHPKYEGYVKKVLDRAHELEVEHYGK